MRAACAIAAGLLVAAASAFAQSPSSSTEKAYEAWERGTAALRDGRAAAAAPDLEAALAAFPKSPDLLYSAARAEALVGEPDKALDALERAAALGFGVGAETDRAFESLAAVPRFRALLPRVAENAKPVSSSSVAFTIPEPDLIPEGAAWDSRTRTLFVGSLHKLKIVSIDSSGRVRDFIQAGRAGLLQILGLRVDPKNRTLWACSAAGDSPRGDPTRRSALLRFDLASGRLAGSYPSRPGGKHLFNDLVVTRGGDVFLTDSEDGGVWRLRRRSATLEAFVPARSLAYPNGIALSEDERLLYVAHDSGIAAWNLKTGARLELSAPDGVTLVSIDGLYVRGSSLIAVQNGVHPERIAVFALSPNGERVVGCRVLERGNPLFDIPTTGAVAGDAFYYMANTQLRALAPGNIVQDPQKRKPVVILRLELPR